METSTCGEERSISFKINTKLVIINFPLHIEILDIFLLFYYKSGALLSEFAWGADNKKEVRIRRLLEIITDRYYSRELSHTLKKGYSFAVIYSEESRFLLSDQYVSTVALSYKNTFVNSSNRAIGMKDTLILLPLSSEYYIAFFNGPMPEYIQPRHILKLSPEQVDEINVAICQNSFI